MENVYCPSQVPPALTTVNNNNTTDRKTGSQNNSVNLDFQHTNNTNAPRLRLPSFRNLIQTISESSFNNRLETTSPITPYGISNNNYVLTSNSPDLAWSSLSKEMEFYNHLYCCLNGNSLLNSHLSYLNQKFNKLFSNINAYRSGQLTDLPTNKADFQALLAEIPDSVFNEITAASETLLHLVSNLKARKFNYCDITTAKKNQQPSPLPTPSVRFMSNDTVSTNYQPSTPSPPQQQPTPKKSNKKPKKMLVTKVNSPLKQKKKRQQKIQGVSKYRAFTPQCKHCSNTNTPEWRKGPDGARTLCNACGLFYSKIVVRFGSSDAAKIMVYKQKSNEQSERIVPTNVEKDKMIRYVNSNTK